MITKSPQTVFFSIPNQVTARTHIMTGVISSLSKSKNTSIIILTPNRDLEKWMGNLSNKVTIRHLPQTKRFSLTNLIYRMVNARYFHVNEIKSMRDNLRNYKIVDKKRWLKETFLSVPFPKNKLIYKFLAWVLKHLPDVTSETKSLFAEYQPDLLVTTWLDTLSEYQVSKLAHGLNVPSVGIIGNWDRHQLKARHSWIPKHYAVFNRRMQSEISSYYDVPIDRIHVTGNPRYDIYENKEPEISRDDFCKLHGLDPLKKTILYGTSPPRVNGREHIVLESIMDQLGRNIDCEYQVVIRVHAEDHKNLYKNLSKRDNVTVHVPNNMLKSEIDPNVGEKNGSVELKDTLSWSDVVMGCASSLAVDSCCVNTPYINITFDLDDSNYYLSPRRICDRDHFRDVESSGGARYANSVSEAVNLLGIYLETPSKDSIERSDLISKVIHKNDGKSGDRIVRLITHILQKNQERSIS